jgi:hypothetical protein
MCFHGVHDMQLQKQQQHGERTVASYPRCRSNAREVSVLSLPPCTCCSLGDTPSSNSNTAVGSGCSRARHPQLRRSLHADFAVPSIIQLLTHEASGATWASHMRGMQERRAKVHMLRLVLLLNGMRLVCALLAACRTCLGASCTSAAKHSPQTAAAMWQHSPMTLCWCSEVGAIADCTPYAAPLLLAQQV